jgi:hypothetical protein
LTAIANDPWMQFPDVQRAPRTVGHREGETAVSILVRLSTANGMRDMNHLLKSTPYLRIGQVSTRETRIEAAARMSGLPAPAIDAATPTVIGSHHMAVAGEVFNHRGTMFGRTCPSCISGDLDAYDAEPVLQRAYRRGWWQVPSISTCPLHGVGLIGACYSCGHPLDERLAVGSCRCGVRDFKQHAVAADDCVHDAWLLGRLGLATQVKHQHLDNMQPAVAAELCRILGSSAKGERVKSGKSADARSLVEARSLGWRIMQGGEAELERTLDAIVVRNQSRGSVCNTSYDGLNRFLTKYSDPALNAVRSQILSHARSNIGLEGGRARMFGRAILDGERLSLTQGAKILGVSDNMLANVLNALEPNAQMNAAGPKLLDRDQLVAARNALQKTMRSCEAKKILGFEKRVMDFAIERGLLDCLMPQSRGHAGLISRQSVARILSAFNNFPVVANPELLDPASLARLGDVTQAEVLMGVVEGKLRPIGRSEAVAGFRALRFQPTCAETLCELLLEKISRLRVADALGWMARTIMALQSRHLLDINSGEAVGLPALASFRREYATAKEAAGWLLKPPRDAVVLHRLLKRTCGLPAMSGSEITAFWRRSLMAAKLRPLMRTDANIHAIGFGSDDWLRNRIF